MKNNILPIIIKRILSSFILLFLIISFLFFLIRMAPGNGMYRFISPDLSSQMISVLQNKFHLTENIFSQYTSFLNNIVIGDFGISFTHKIPVVDVLLKYVPFSIIFASVAFIFQFTLGCLLALFTFKTKKKLIVKIINNLALTLYSTPAFVIALFLIFIFSVSFKIFPSSGLNSLQLIGQSGFNVFLDLIKHMILPIITLTLYGIPTYYKYLSEQMNVVSKSLFVENLRANGFSENRILYSHILPNSLNPVISIAGVSFGQLFSGALVIEVIFGLPGIGRLSLEAIMSRNFPLVIGCTVVSALVIFITNLCADIIKIVIDKREASEILN